MRIVMKLKLKLEILTISMNRLFDLTGKTCVVVGGAGLVGRAFCEACAAQGGNVIIAEKNKETGGKLVEYLQAHYPNQKFACEGVDIADGASVEALAEQIKKQYGDIHGLVNASYPRTAAYGKKFQEANVEDMTENLSLHVGGTLALIKSFAPIMPGGSSIVLMGSIYGIAAPRFGMYQGTEMTVPAEYAAAKGAATALTRYFASLLGPKGIRVNAISPGGVADNQPQSFVEHYSKHVRLGTGLLQPEDLAGALVFLLSETSEKMTGQNLIIDAGWTL